MSRPSGASTTTTTTTTMTATTMTTSTKTLSANAITSTRDVALDGGLGALSSPTPAKALLSTTATAPATATAPPLAHPDDVRTRFSMALSAMYRSEVPLYGDLLELVAGVNAAACAKGRGGALSPSPSPAELHRLTVERHGAVRVGSPAELRLLAGMFSLMGMRAVGYYDLHASSGLPIHATAFRPLGAGALAHNPFRVFTSLLRLEAIRDPDVRALAEGILRTRRIASPAFEALLRECTALGGVPSARVAHFVEGALDVFRWHSATRVCKETYDELKAAHPLVADIVCFHGPHVNHLTPRSLDIDAVQRGMRQRGIDAKDVIEGPPGGRRCDILLRQTSFKARCEAVYFRADDGEATVYGHHTARFGEIESRGAALTQRGMQWYQERLGRATREQQAREGQDGDGDGDGDYDYEAALHRHFADFPDDWAELRRAGLAYFSFGVAAGAGAGAGASAEAAKAREDASTTTTTTAAQLVRSLAQQGLITAEAITYEDFLPASAAGIFSSNLAGGAGGAQDGQQQPRQEQQREDADNTGIYCEDADDGKAQLEEACGMEVLDVQAVYEGMQRESVVQLLRAVGREVRDEEEMGEVMRVLVEEW